MKPFKSSLLLYEKHIVIILAVCLSCIGGCSTHGSSVKVKQETPTAQKVKPDSSQPAQVKVDRIEVLDLKNACRVKITATKPPTYAVFKLNRPERIIVDLPEVLLDKNTVIPAKVQNNVIREIKTTPMEKNGKPSAHIEIILMHDAAYDTTQKEANLFIDIIKPQSDLNKNATQVPKQKDARQTGSQVKVSSGEKPSAHKNSITDVKINEIGTGCQITIVADSNISGYYPFTLKKPPRLAIDFPMTTSALARTTFSSKSPLISEMRVGTTGDKVRLVVDFPGSRVPLYEIDRQGKELSINIGAQAKACAQTEKPVEQPSVQKESNENREAVPEQKTTSAKEAAKGGETPQYTGQKISLDFKDADIKNLLRLISEVSGYNIITSDKVAGRVTLKLENLPWDQALDIILDTSNLGKIVSGNIIRIDTKDQILKAKSDRIEETALEDIKMETVPVSYVKARDIEKYIKDLKLLTDKRGSINAFEHTNTITITDVPDKVKKIKQLIKEQDIPTRQVLIEARIVQSNPSYAKELGVKWGSFYNTLKDGGRAQGGADIAVSGAAGSGSVVNLPAPVGMGSGGGINFGYLTDSLQLDVQLTALESEEKIKIVSSPKILGLDNKEARIKQGVALPYLKLSEQGVTSTEFKDAVLELKVTPKISPANTVNLHVFVTKNQKSSQTGAGGEPGIDIREVETDLLVESGKTIVIGGIYENTKFNSLKKVPFFANLPFFGRFFRNERT
ncbi:MAG: type IV pilus secretin PilQ, partial [Proteobacteria bacterium]|nr:type IV pilus secretin PilQ [Pseudomonadota bacterium]